MIEQSQRPLLPSSLSELDVLQRRANDRRSRHRQSARLFQTQWHQARTTIGSPARSIHRLPARFLLHTVIVLILPLAVVMSQLRVGMILPTSQPAIRATQDELAAPVAPLSLNTQSIIGDAPLDDDGEIPIPLSLVSRNEALAPVVVNATIAGERIYLRNGPGTEYDAVARMSIDAPVQVIGRYNDWFQVRESVDKPIYWVSGELLNIPAEQVYTLFEIQPEALPAAPQPKIATVRDSGLQLRDGPGTNYIPMTKFEAGMQLDVIERYEDWYHVGVPGGTDGWVKGEFLNIEESVVNRLLVAETIPDPNPALVGTITDNAVNLRQGPDSKYGKVGQINAGVQVDLIGKYNDWFKIQQADGSKSWVFRDLLNISERVLRRVPVTKDFPALPKPAARAKPAGGSGTAANPRLTEIPASGDVASYAVQFVGSSYKWGGASPSGFDCSGLTQYVYGKYGVKLPHNAAAQFNTRYGASVGSMDNLQAGDLVFFVRTTSNPGITHVGIYIGGGRMVGAMTPKYGVQVSNINEQYWVSRYYGAIRVSR